MFNLKIINKVFLRWDLNKILFAGGVMALVFVLMFFVWWHSESIFVENDLDAQILSEGLRESSISGIQCDEADQRPIAVMMAADPETRPLSGIGEADLVFEMPVTPNGITRFMAVFQCSDPIEIGSIRSAREDFIPLAAGMGAIYAHWGGEREALKKLDGHITDNIDGLKYDGTIFYRKKGIPMPHNGFTNLENIISQSDKLNYSPEDRFSGYSHEKKEFRKNISNLAEEIKINYPYPYDVRWTYNQETKEYQRFRGGEAEIDRNNQKQVSVKVVVVMKTTSKYLNLDYIKINIEGLGDALIYQDGIVLSGKWQKDPLKLDSKLYFYDNEGNEIHFLPGKIWVEVVTN